MRRYSQVIKLRPEAKEEYIRYHADVWPGVLARIEMCNIRNYSIFLYGDLLIAYFEYHGADFDADMKLMAADPETQRWWAIMDPMQVPLPEATKAGTHWLTVPEVFHFDGAPVAKS
ncbi:MAG: L-rhamnose mutarotase [Acidobacteria bacterium]|nr:L-rhamnose mutarotase [Acidobacteriota bacterium]